MRREDLYKAMSGIDADLLQKAATEGKEKASQHQQNGKKNGMSFILIGNKESLADFTDAADYQIDCSGQSAKIGTKAQLPIEFTEFNPISEEEISGIFSSLQAS